MKTIEMKGKIKKEIGKRINWKSLLQVVGGILGS
jgi:hypothetical protein